jgi:hypothetical protein
MKRLIFVLFLFAGHLVALQAQPFEQAEVIKTINLVSLLPQDSRAVPGDIVNGDTALQTGGHFRAELQFPDLTIIRGETFRGNSETDVADAGRSTRQNGAERQHRSLRVAATTEKHIEGAKAFV